VHGHVQQRGGQLPIILGAMGFHWILAGLLSLPIALNAHGLHGTWLSEGGTCMEFNPTSRLLMLDPISWYGGWRYGRQRFEYVVRREHIVIAYFHDQTLLGWRKEWCRFRIDSLTQDGLRLELVDRKHGEAILELIGIREGYVTFRRSLVSCMEYGWPQRDQ